MKILTPVVLILVGWGFLFAKETHWAFTPLDRPAGKDVDFFVNSELKTKKLTLSPPYGFTTWLSGGGTKAGLAHGATDEFGYRAAEDKVHVHDLHATILHLLALNHKHLTYRHQWRDYRIIDAHGRIVREILA